MRQSSRVWKLPVAWVCENDPYSIHPPVEKSVAAREVADLAREYNMPGPAIDGKDVLRVPVAAVLVTYRARRGDGPILIECKCCYYRKHGEGDIPTPYGTKDEVEAWTSKQPIAPFRERLLTGDLVSGEELDAVDASISSQVSGAAKWALEQLQLKPGVLPKENSYLASPSCFGPANGSRSGAARCASGVAGAPKMT